MAFFARVLPVLMGTAGGLLAALPASLQAADWGGSIYFPHLGVESLALKASPGTRRCCMLGADLAMLGLVPTRQTVDPSQVGTHFYGYGKGEENGMIASCRGGFMDIAHLRYAADLVLKFAVEIEALGAQGGELKIKSEAGRGRLFIEPFRDSEGIRMRTPGEVLELAGSVALDVVSWHEIITWFNYSAVPFYTEKGSSFSPEDPFSNQLGIQLAKKAILRSTQERISYSESMSQEIQDLLFKAGALPEAETVRVLRALDQHSSDLIGDPWFDSHYQLPNYRRLLKRNMDLFGELTPVMPPQEILSKACSSVKEPLLRVHQKSLWNQYTLEVRLKKLDSAGRQVMAFSDRTVSQRDFPFLVEWVKGQIEDEWPNAIIRPSQSKAPAQGQHDNSE